MQYTVLCYVLAELELVVFSISMHVIFLMIMILHSS